MVHNILKAIYVRYLQKFHEKQIVWGIMHGDRLAFLFLITICSSGKISCPGRFYLLSWDSINLPRTVILSLPTHHLLDPYFLKFLPLITATLYVKLPQNEPLGNKPQLHHNAHICFIWGKMLVIAVHKMGWHIPYQRDWVWILVPFPIQVSC